MDAFATAAAGVAPPLPFSGAETDPPHHNMEAVMRSRMRYLTALTLATLAAAACESATGGGPGDNQVRIDFGARASATHAGIAGGPSAAAAADDQIVISGDNGELTITDIRLIVEEFELKGDDDVNPCEANGGGDDCEDFDAGPLFVDLPLNGAATVTTGQLPPGAYREVDFEIEDLDDDETNPAEAARIDQVLAQVRAAFPDWPRKASMLVVGSFRPRSGGALGEPRPFRVFVDAEIEIELDLAPPLVVGDGAEPRTVSVTLDPAVIFQNGGQVVDLSAFNGRLVEFELDHLERGFQGSSRAPAPAADGIRRFSATSSDTCGGKVVPTALFGRVPLKGAGLRAR